MAAPAVSNFSRSSLSCIISSSSAQVHLTSLCSIACQIPSTAHRLRAAPKTFSSLSLNSFLAFRPLANPRSSARVITRAKKASGVERAEEKEQQLAIAAVEEEEEEVEISWIQEKAEDLVLATGQAIDRVPGPRVGDGRLPWLVAVPLGYLGITFVIAVVKTFRRYNSPKGKRKRQVRPRRPLPTLSLKPC